MKVPHPTGKPARLLAATFTVCLSAGILEVALTRLASALFFHDMAYLAVSGCLLALGAGAAAGTTRFLSALSPRSAMMTWGFLTSAWVAVSGHEIMGWWTGMFMTPMVSAGLFLALAYAAVSGSRGPEGAADGGRVEILYACEIVGFSIGLGLVGPMILPWAGPVGAMALSAALPPLWVLFFPKEAGQGTPDHAVGTVGIRLWALAALAATAFAPSMAKAFTTGPQTGMTHLSAGLLSGTIRPLEGRWSSFARTDLAFDSKGMAMIFTDGMFCARAPAWDGKSTRFESDRAEAMASLKRVPYLLRRPGSAMVMGSGAGFDVAVALQHGAEKVFAIEVNPDMVAMASALEGTTGVSYLDPRVEVSVTEARKFAQTFRGRVDHLSLSLMETSPASIRGRTHVHSATLTVEAFSRYLAILEPEGIIAVINNTIEFHESCASAALRALETDLGEVISMTGTSKPGADAGSAGNSFNHLLMVSRKPFSPMEMQIINDLAERYGWTVTEKNDPAKTKGVTKAHAPTDERPFFFSGETTPFHGWAAAAAGLSIFVILMPVSRQMASRAAKSKGGSFEEEQTWRKVPVGVSVSLFLSAAGISAAQVGMLHRTGQAIGSPATAVGAGLAAMVAGAGAGALLWERAKGFMALWRAEKMRVRADEPGRKANSACLEAMIIGWVPGVVSFAVLGLASGSAAGWLAGLAKPWAMATTGFLTALFFLPSGLPFVEAMRQMGRWNRGGFQGIGLMADGCGAVWGTGLSVVLAPVFGISTLFFAAAGLVALSAVAMALPAKDGTGRPGN